MDVYTRTSEDQRLVARVKAEPMDEDTQLKMYLDMTRVHIFEPGTYGVNLTNKDAVPV